MVRQISCIFLSTNDCLKIFNRIVYLTLNIMYFAYCCCKQWKCEVLRRHHCCGMWPCFTGRLRQCVDVSFKGRKVSELRISWENIFGKLVVVVNRNNFIYIYIYIFDNLGNFRYFLLPRNQSVTKKIGIRSSKAQNFTLISMYTWHICSRWYTSDFSVVTNDI